MTFDEDILYTKLKEKIKRENLVPDSRIPGKFVNKRQEHSDGIGHLAPNNWVFHNQIADCVLSGKYEEINPVCTEFITTLNCSNRCSMCGYKFVKMLEGNWKENDYTDPVCHMPNFEYARDFLDILIDGGIKGWGMAPALQEGRSHAMSWRPYNCPLSTFIIT